MLAVEVEVAEETGSVPAAEEAEVEAAEETGPAPAVVEAEVPEAQEVSWRLGRTELAATVGSG